jgi:hypothetical protein
MEQEFEEFGDDGLTRMRSPRGGGFVNFLPSDRGSKLLRRWESYYNLARAGGSKTTSELCTTALGLILLDSEDRQRQPEGSQASAGGKEESAS